MARTAKDDAEQVDLVGSIGAALDAGDKVEGGDDAPAAPEPPRKAGESPAERFARKAAALKALRGA